MIIERSCFRTIAMKPMSLAKRSSCLLALVVPASWPKARLEVREEALALMDFSTSWSCAGISVSTVSKGNCVALTAIPHKCDNSRRATSAAFGRGERGS